MTREFPARPIVGLGAVVLRGNSVLLIRRGRPPNVGEWAIPGGAQKLGETAEAGARREVLEETGIRAGPLQFVAHVDSIHTAADGAVRFHYTILDFAALWTGGVPAAGGDALAAEFVPFDALDGLDLWPEAYRVIGLARDLLNPFGEVASRASS